MLNFVNADDLLLKISASFGLSIDDIMQQTRRRRIVNISRISKVTKPNETIVVPGKVLGAGSIAHKVKVAAYQFSGSAKQKVSTLSIPELIKENPKGKDVRIIG